MDRMVSVVEAESKAEEELRQKLKVEEGAGNGYCECIGCEVCEESGDPDNDCNRLIPQDARDWGRDELVARVCKKEQRRQKTLCVLPGAPKRQREKTK